VPPPTIKPGDPFCTQCGLVLHGFEAAPRCPECAAPLPAALDRYKAEYARATMRARRRRSDATLWGWPLVDIAFGPDPGAGERSGRARGIIAIGDTAIGGLAIGGAAVGVVAIGGGSVGVVAIGGGSVGLLAAIGGLALGGYAGGGMAAGGIASGGLSVGVVAQGAAAMGVYARGVSAGGVHVISPSQRDPAAVQMFERLAPIVGATPAPAPAGAGAAGGAGVLPSTALPLGVVVPLLLAGLLAAIIGGVVVHGQRRYERRRQVEIDDAILAPPRGGARQG
jgi:hypothetical protein